MSPARRLGWIGRAPLRSAGEPAAWIAAVAAVVAWLLAFGGLAFRSLADAIIGLANGVR